MQCWHVPPREHCLVQLDMGIYEYMLELWPNPDNQSNIATVMVVRVNPV